MQNYHDFQDKKIKKASLITMVRYAIRQPGLQRIIVETWHKKCLLMAAVWKISGLPGLPNSLVS